MNVYLIGFMGSGKSAYAERLAKQLKWHLMDLDKVVEEKAELSIPEIFNAHGEAYFRRLETEALKSTESISNTVIATGGGAPCSDQNIDWMNQNGITVYLKLLEDKLLKRLKKGQEKRPLITGMNADQLQKFVSENLKARSYYYLQAQIVIDPIDYSPKMLKQELKNRMHG